MTTLCLAVQSDCLCHLFLWNCLWQIKIHWLIDRVIALPLHRPRSLKNPSYATGWSFGRLAMPSRRSGAVVSIAVHGCSDHLRHQPAGSGILINNAFYAAAVFVYWHGVKRADNPGFTANSKRGFSAHHELARREWLCQCRMEVMEVTSYTARTDLGSHQSTPPYMHRACAGRPGPYYGRRR